ncbi:MAG: hypothetical protein J0I34_18140 [Pseudonocardia sp.]|uniref:hypothetical protein n=1 Tax=unclassified Pseudonocardia TaxID=2619320 RepID=UPI00086E1029|nr:MULTISPECIES: hypothetical protein [unclassified Pseudonocardia]MBN9110686.1 hypothetical protein [Pseudonocardia sp.]ODV04396.1 MAG: hypothetical protein ABT15_20670 [Pseudonocardia sp. SCN 73-27]
MASWDDVRRLAPADALIADDPADLFTTPHFDGDRTVLVRLDAIAADELAEVVEGALPARASKRLAATYLEAR